MHLDQYALLFIKLGILFIGVYVLTVLTPKLARFIDRKKSGNNGSPEVPRPERVQNDDFLDIDDNSADDDKKSDESADSEYKSE